MNTEMLYLKPNVVIEPLVDRWYAWAHLVSPATASRNIVKRHLKIINSYIQAPHIHAAAVKNPKMLGGPFMDLEDGRLEDVKSLKADTLAKQEDLIEFSSALDELERVLKEHENGYSLESVYEKVPDILKGYVELIYDLNNNPSYRFFEPLLYNSKYYKPASQSIALWVTENDERPFCLSTPRLDAEDVLHLNIPFSHKGIDELSKMKRTANSLENIAALLGIGEEDMELFSTFFTKEEPPKYEYYTGDKVRMRYFGHACILVETKDVSILIDPLISYYGYDSPVDHFSDVDLPDVIDYVLITHNHQDHVLFETLLPLRHKVKNIIVPRTSSGLLQDPNLKLMFEQIGFDNIVEIDEMQSIRFEDCTMTGLPFTGEHCDLNIKSKICYHVKVEDFSLMFVADSRIIESRLYEHIQQMIGDVDVVFLGMECDGAPLTWLYGPLLPEDISRDKDSRDRKSTRLNSSHQIISYAVFCLKKKKQT